MQIHFTSMQLLKAFTNISKLLFILPNRIKRDTRKCLLKLFLDVEAMKVCWKLSDKKIIPGLPLSCLKKYLAFC